MAEKNEGPETPESKALHKLTEQIRSTTNKLEDVSDAIKVIPSITAYGRRTRIAVIGLVASFVLDIALTIILAIIGVSAHTTAANLRNEQIAACTQGNMRDQDIISTWHKLFALSGTTNKQTGQTEAQYKQAQKLLSEFYAYVSKTYAPVNCQARYADPSAK